MSPKEPQSAPEAPNSASATEKLEENAVNPIGRRRPWLAFLGILVIGGLGAAAGYLAVPVEYESKALIRIAPVLPRILYETELSEVLPMYDAYVCTQMELIQSQRVADRARQSKTWTQAGGGYSLAGLARFEKRVSVSRPEQTQLIAVSFRERTPERAQAGATAVVDAYMRLYGENDIASQNQRFQILEERARSLSTQIEELHARRMANLKEMVPPNLEMANQMAVQELEGLGQSLAEARQTIEIHRQRKADEGATTADDTTDPALKRLTAREREMNEAYEEAKKQAVRVQLRSLQVEEIQRQLNRLQDSLDLTNRRIEELSLEHSAVSGRVSLLSAAELPTEPSNTDKRVWFAGLGAFAGILMALAVVAVYWRSKATQP